MNPSERCPVIVAGVRTPFLDSAGQYADLMSYELGAEVIRALLTKTGLNGNQIDLVIMGTVLHEIETTNVAREAMLAAGMPSRVPAYTVAMAGISPNVGVMNICDQISLGRIKMGIASGTENFSDVPIRLSQKIRRSLMKIRQNKNSKARLSVLASLRPGDFTLDIPDGSDYTTGMTMGVACEAMVKKFGLSRQACDEFTARSHALALQATDAGHYQAQICPVQINHTHTASVDNTPRKDATITSLSKLKPVFDKQQGIITAGTSSRFTDGAAALLITSLAEAERQQLNAIALVKDYVLTGVDSLQEEMLLGPAMSIPKLLQRNQLDFNDIEVWEIHEAFAAQVLINLNCMADDHFVKTRLGQQYPSGTIKLDQLNSWGGSLALGNPFAATGGRLFMTAAQRLQHSGARYAVISTCAGGGLGAAILLENPNSR